MRPRLLRASISLLALAAMSLPAYAQAGSTKISKNHCATTGGGRFVEIKEFPGERIDPRLLADIEYLRKRFKIYDESIGGDWGDINDLARWAEHVARTVETIRCPGS